MNVNFELFEEGQADQKTGERMRVTLSKDFKIFFNTRAVAALGDPDGVALLYDRRLQIIGVMPSALNRKHAYRLRYQQRGSRGRVITARNFCRHYEINLPETIAFTDAEVNKDGILVLDLHAAAAAGRRET